jgi:hypothetical protein
MSNKKRKPMSGLPSIESLKPGMEVKSSIDETITSFTETAPIEPISPKIEFVSFTLPVQSEVVALSFQDEATRVDFKNKIGRNRMAKIHALRRGMTSTECRLSDGSIIKSNTDVLLYILDQIVIPD